MRPLSAEEYDQIPTYLVSQLSLPLDRVNECIDSVNNVVTDKRFENGASADTVTHEELTSLLRLGGKTKTFILLLVHCGKLRGLDSPTGRSYKITN